MGINLKFGWFVTLTLYVSLISTNLFVLTTCFFDFPVEFIYWIAHSGNTSHLVLMI